MSDLRDQELAAQLRRRGAPQQLDESVRAAMVQSVAAATSGRQRSGAGFWARVLAPSGAVVAVALAVILSAGGVGPDGGTFSPSGNVSAAPSASGSTVPGPTGS